jgi:hypothetical protein
MSIIYVVQSHEKEAFGSCWDRLIPTPSYQNHSARCKKTKRFCSKNFIPYPTHKQLGKNNDDPSHNITETYPPTRIHQIHASNPIFDMRSSSRGQVSAIDLELVDLVVDKVVDLGVETGGESFLGGELVEC